MKYAVQSFLAGTGAEGSFSLDFSRVQFSRLLLKMKFIADLRI